jgi:hypothetical protein
MRIPTKDSHVLEPVKDSTIVCVISTQSHGTGCWNSRQRPKLSLGLLPLGASQNQEVLKTGQFRKEDQFVRVNHVLHG